MIRRAGRAKALARANALANALTLARDLARDLGSTEMPVGTLARANALALTLTNASALDLDCAPGLDRALRRSRDLARARLDCASDLAHVRLAHVRLARDLVHDLVELDPTAHCARAVVVDGGRSIPGRVPRGLVALAVRLLPEPRRSRYCAEFYAELVEMPRRQRLGYSLRVLAVAWQLRRALNEAVNSPEGAPARRAEW